MATAKVWAKAIPHSGRLAKTVPVSTELISRDNTKPSLASIATIKANSSKLSQPTKKPNHFNRTAFAPFHDPGVQQAEYHDGQKRIKKSGEWTGITALHTQIIAGQRIAFHHIEKHRIDGIHQHTEPYRINQAGDKVGFKKIGSYPFPTPHFRPAICSTAACAQYSPNEAVTSILAP